MQYYNYACACGRRCCTVLCIKSERTTGRVPLVDAGSVTCSSDKEFRSSDKELRSAMADQSNFFLDTNVASLILDGELWNRSPSTLMGHRKELVPAWEMAQHHLQSVPKFNLELARSVSAFSWAQQRFASKSPPLLLSPTVQHELSAASQVS